MGCVYLVTNMLNGDEYVGCSRYTAQRRWEVHVARAYRGKTHFARAIVKYGAKNFSLTVLDDGIDFREALAQERVRIRERKPRYNLTAGGEGVLGWTPSAKTRQLWSTQRKGRKHPPERAEQCRAALRSAKARENHRAAMARPEVRAKLAEKGKLRTFSQEHIDKLTSHHRGVPMSDAHKEAIRTALKASARSRAHVVSRMKGVICLTTGKIYEGARAAAADTGLTYQIVQKICNKTTPSGAHRASGLAFAHTIKHEIQRRRA